MDLVRINETRNISFTSSQMVRLAANGRDKKSPSDKFYTYIEEVAQQIRLGRPLSKEQDAKAALWGKLCEKYVFETSGLLGLEYTPMGDTTLKHPTINQWAGTPDVKREGFVGDIKCPFTMGSFCGLVDEARNEKREILHEALTVDAFKYNHKDGDKFYWQLVSNAILLGVDKAELIVFCPYQSELEAIRDLASKMPNDYEYRFVTNAHDSELPYLIDGGHYKNLNKIEFDIPQADIDFLTGRVLKAVRLLNT